MRWKQSLTNKHHTYNQYNTELVYHYEISDLEWVVAQDIQDMYRKKYNKYVSLPKIGKVAKKYGLVKKLKGLGFKLYHISLVDLL